MRQQLQNAALKAVDWTMAGMPRAIPDQLALQDCKIISHRGEHNRPGTIENTLPAFQIARAAGVWGIECDIRWTSDLVPIISHDASCQRLFGDPVLLHTLSFAQIRERFPPIPSLQEVLVEFGGATHLMLEIKADHYPEPARQQQVLQDLLSPLIAGQDFHFLALDPSLFEYVDFLPRRFCMLVAQLNTSQLSKQCIEQEFGGFAGHFLLLKDKLMERHVLSGQRIGTGFISSKNSLFRELNRGVEWIFSNDAVKIQKIRDRYLE